MRDKEKKNKLAKEWRVANPKRVRLEWRKADLKRKFGMSIDTYYEMLRAQDGACAICGGKNKRINLAVDHDHVTGKIRQLLCGHCNTSLAVLESDMMPKYQEYLSKHKEAT